MVYTGIVDTILIMVAGIFIGLIISAIIARLMTSRTKSYRKDLTNLYVSSRIRQLAKKNDLDLVEEYESFKAYSKKRRLEDKDLDNVIEEELKDQVSEGIKNSKK